MRYSAFAFVIVAALSGSVVAQASLQFETAEIVLNPKVGEDEVRAAFKFTNTGDGPVAIRSVESSCGCTVPEKPKAPIAPGESGEIVVTYKIGERQGVQRQGVQVVTEDGASHALRLEVNVPARVTFSPRLIVFRGADAGPRSATLTFAEVKETKLLDVSVPSPAFELVGEPKLEKGVLKLSFRHLAGPASDDRASVRVRTRDSSGKEHVDVLYLRHVPALSS